MTSLGIFRRSLQIGQSDVKNDEIAVIHNEVGCMRKLFRYQNTE